MADELDDLLSKLSGPSEASRESSTGASLAAQRETLDGLDSLLSALDGAGPPPAAPPPPPPPRNDAPSVNITVTKTTVQAQVNPGKANDDFSELDDVMADLVTPSSAPPPPPPKRDSSSSSSRSSGLDELDDLAKSLTISASTSSSSSSAPPAASASVSVSSSAPPAASASVSVSSLAKNFPGGQSITVKSTTAQKPPASSAKRSDDVEALTASLGASLGTGDRPICESCRKPIATGEVLKASNRTYHPDHFTCAECRRPIGTTQYFPDGSRNFCVECFAERNGRCAGCHQAITGGTIFQALGKTWHPDHFVCAHCKHPFPEGRFQERDGRAYCHRDYDNLFGVKCSNCRETINGDMMSVGHLKYHNSCFVCASCRKNLGTTYYEREGQVYCQAHANQSAGRCAGCQTEIFGEALTAMNRKWHPAHFQCRTCRSAISGTYKEVDNEPYCNPCAQRLVKSS